MKLWLALAFVVLNAAPALAQSCSPPAGLSLQQWYGMCQGALEQAYSMGMAQGAPYQYFVQSMYQVYAQPPMMPYGQMQGGQSGAANMCNLGESQCFSGYVRTCEQMATGGTWWVTGAQQCE